MSESPPAQARRLTPADRARRICFALAWLLALMQALAVVPKMRHHTDLDTYYRAAEAVWHGARAELYTTPDPLTHWGRPWTPAGYFLFVWMAWFPLPVSAAIWIIANLAMLVLAAVMLRAVLRDLDRQRRLLGRMTPWAIVILLVLASGSLQVGQYSVLFAFCWIAYLWADRSNRHALAAFALAVPPAMKVYPLVLGAVPLVRGRWQQVLLALLALGLLGTVGAWLVLGAGWQEMWVAFYRHVLTGSSNWVSEQSILERSNESLDMVMRRWLTDDPSFHPSYPWLPHLALPEPWVVGLANLLRGVVVAVSLMCSILWVRRSRPAPRYQALVLMALWSAVLYIVLPEVKSRYAVYAFPAFVPALGLVAAAVRRGDRRGMVGWGIALLAWTLLVAQVVPYEVRMLGTGIVSVIMLWGVNLRRLAVDLRSRRESPAPRQVPFA